MRRRTLVGMALSGVALAQNAPAVEFEVASVRKAPGGGFVPQSSGSGPAPPPPPPILKPTPGGLIIEGATLQYCLIWAYDVRNSQVSGPAWIYDSHYNISARTSSPAATDQLRQMLQKLLTARFRLKLHRETKERPVLALVLTRQGSKLARSKPDTVPSQKVTRLSGGVLRLEAKNAGLNFLEPMLRLPVWDPVVNMTGLTGGFDFTFEKPPFRGDPQVIFDELNRALQRQLGLQLEPRKAPIDTIVIDDGNPNPITVG